MSTDRIEFDLTSQTLKRVRTTETEVDPKYLIDLMQETGIQLSPMLRPGTFVGFTQNGSIIVQELRDIPFKVAVNVAVEEDGTPVYVPDYADKSGVRSEDAQLVFNPPEGQRIYLVVKVEEASSLIIAQDILTGNLHYPALPNVYSHGVLCTGDADLPPSNRVWSLGLEGYFGLWLEAWSSCDFNADLNSNGNGSIELACKFDVKTGANIPLENWRTLQTRLAPDNDTAQLLQMVWERTNTVDLT